MTTPTIYTFFARLAEHSGYFVAADNLRDVEFPTDLIAADSRGGFPDIVLKCFGHGKDVCGGEFVELKDAKSMSIPSFNSSIPTACKKVDELPAGLLRRLDSAGELPDCLLEREVYYLVRGRDLKARPAPKTKVLLISGAFFETVTPSRLLRDAFDQVANEATGITASIDPDVLKAFERRENFARVRHVQGASVKVRFRVMTEAETEANLMNEKLFPQFPADTFSLLVPLHGGTGDGGVVRPFPWNRPPLGLERSAIYRHVDAALKAVSTSIMGNATGFVMPHPLNGPFFVVQLPLNWS